MTRASRIAGLCALAAALALGFAFILENRVGLVPCALCLWERWPYRVVIGLGLLGTLIPSLARVALWLILIALLVGVGMSATHVGVEQGLWPSPLPECMEPRLSGSITDRLSQLPALPSKSCEDAVYLIPAVPVSLALGDLLFALALAAWVAISLRRPSRRRR